MYPEVSLKLARERRADARAILDRADDPGAAKREAKAQAERDAVNTFRSVGGAWLDHQSAKWATDACEAIRISLETHGYPKLTDLPLASIRPRDVAGVVRSIEAKGAGETAAHVLQRIRAVFRYAVVHD